MRIYNTGFVAHVDAGKTTLTEQLLLKSGAIDRAGSVDRGTAKTDFMDIEQRRGISVRAAAVSLFWENAKIHLIDTPGHADFAADVERALRVLDCAVLLVSAAEGVQARTELLYRALAQRNLPVIVFINKTDRIGADVDRTMAQLKEKLSPDMVLFSGKSNDDLCELLADRDETLFERVLAGEAVPRDELDAYIASWCQSRQLFPVFYGSALKGEGIEVLLRAMVRYFPYCEGGTEKPFSALVYKLEHDPKLGALAHVRLYGGQVGVRDNLYNTRTQAQEKVTQLFTSSGGRLFKAEKVSCGEVAVLCGQSHARIGDILGDPSFVPKAPAPAKPLLSVRVSPNTPDELPKLLAALEELTSEDPMLDLRWEPTLREILLSITGLIQLEVLDELLKTRFHLTAQFDKPTVVYMETPSQRGVGFVAYTMPKPCWAVMELYFEPLPPGSGVIFESVVNPNQILPRYQTHIETCLPRALRQGPQGWQVTDVRITLTDGSHHQFHTHPLDFFVATPMAVMDGLTRIGTTLLEPYMRFEAHVPEKCGPGVIGEVLRMRGEMTDSRPDGEMIVQTGAVPLATSLDFPVFLASFTSGKGNLFLNFDSYRPCPPQFGQTAPYRGVHPLDTARYILAARGALADELAAHEN